MVVGEDAGLECKTTTTLDLKKYKNNEYPDHYYVQCVHYMMVTGAKRWYLAVLVLGKGFYVFEIERDEAEISALAKSEEAFWEYVQSKTPPICDGEKSTTESIGYVFSDVSNSICDLTVYEHDILERQRINAEIAALKKRRNAVDNRIKSFMGNAGYGECNGFRVSWNISEKEDFDQERFIKDHPHMDLTPYFSKKKSRVFRVNERKDA